MADMQTDLFVIVYYYLKCSQNDNISADIKWLSCPPIENVIIVCLQWFLFWSFVFFTCYYDKLKRVKMSNKLDTVTRLSEIC